MDPPPPLTLDPSGHASGGGVWNATEHPPPPPVSHPQSCIPLHTLPSPHAPNRTQINRKDQPANLLHVRSPCPFAHLKVICGACRGSGSRSGRLNLCYDCAGHGVKRIARQLGPGLVQQMETTCTTCHGSGFAVDPRNMCPLCNGNKVRKERKLLEV